MITTKRACLLISDIQELKEEEKYFIELYDGKYSLFTTIRMTLPDASEIKEPNENVDSKKAIHMNPYEDEIEIANLIREQKIFVGQKLQIAGMYVKYEGIHPKIEEKSDDKCPHYLLSRQGSCSLYLNYNSISRARVNDKLGLQKDDFLTKMLKDVSQV